VRENLDISRWAAPLGLHSSASIKQDDEQVSPVESPSQNQLLFPTLATVLAMAYNFDRPEDQVYCTFLEQDHR
jgi:hypothetical protein